MKARFDQYKVEPPGFWQVTWTLGDGYDVMETAERHQWVPISVWGRNGWDLGSWPLVVVYFRDREHTMDQIITYDLALYLEGDVFMWQFPDPELRNACTDELAFEHWKDQDEKWVTGIESVEQMPNELRGPFSWKRLKKEQEQEEEQQ